MKFFSPFFFLILCLIQVICLCCNPGNKKTEAVRQVFSASDFGLEKLSEYNFFKGRMAELIPAEGVMPYDLNTPLFSDYALKLRFVKIPPGQKAVYNNHSVFDFPVGTVLIKNFYYPHDFRDESKGRKVMETRLLIHEDTGWKALPYVWNDEQTEAFLEVAGGHKDVSWVHSDGSTKAITYSIPNVNQCKGCHVKGAQVQPIGPSARQLNKIFTYAGGKMNQLSKWHNAGILSGLPENLSDCPKVPLWDNPNDGTVEARARAYLDINCAHCHSPLGPANTSGLFLDIHETDPTRLGVFKSPVSAGRGSGSLLYDVVPGKPEESITVFRMKSLDPGVMMPEMGRKLMHEEGVKAIEEWIRQMPASFK
ncbi:MAG TPA: SO2930 family diheme c-type cytochrome [Chitinophagales bacterium]|nr:SO2930 family diheme c-type cytochrome [Chitinophagales bacterium]